MPGEQLQLFPLGGIEDSGLPPRPMLSADDSLQTSLAPFTEYMTQREFAENTIKSFANDLKLLTDYAGAQTSLSAFSTHRIEEFMRHLQYGRGVPCSAKSYERRLTTLKVFFGWLAREGILAVDPAAPLVQMHAASPLPRILSDEQIESLQSVTLAMRDAEEAPDARPHLLVSLLLATGIKKAECMGIAPEHIDLSDPVHPVLYIHYDKPRLRFKARHIALPGDWATTLRLYLRRYQPRARLFECTPRNLEYVLHTLSTVAGLPEPLTFATLRWTSATKSYRQGTDEEHLRKRLGLSKIAWRGVLPTIIKLAEGPL